MRVTAKKLGIDIVGYETMKMTSFPRKVHLRWELRESLARVKIFFLVFFKVKAAYLGEKIPIIGNSNASWDMAEQQNK